MSKAKGPTYIVPFKRRRKGLTDYRKRLAQAKSGLPRMVVRKSNNYVTVQFVRFEPAGDKVIASVGPKELKEYGWVPQSNSPTAYLAGLLCGLKAKKNGVDEFVLDMGLYTASKGSIVFACLKGAIDAGLKSGYEAEMVNEARITGAHIADYAKKLKAEDESQYKMRFSDYIKSKVDPESLPKLFEEVKSKIIKGK